MDLLSPSLLASLRGLELTARRTLDGALVGGHRSALPGAGLEFSQYRSYRPGDDPRRVDWKLFSRSGRYFVREAEGERSVTVRIVIDASASMRMASGGVTKFDRARELAAGLAWLAHRQGDAVGVTLLSDEVREVLPPSRARQQVHRVVDLLQRASAKGRWPAWPRIEPLFTAAGGRGIVILISDLHDHADELRIAARKLAAFRHELAVLQLVTPEEERFGWHGAVAFEELETGAIVELDADRAREAYLAARAAERAERGRDLADLRADHQVVSIDEPAGPALRRWLAARAARR
ncbi:MAG TPA: DUF58 domain-containing protein [Gemmatimonadales bacterium]|nr:DUF58 domain-containing protein [Gemmatimonadales bacterium]